MPGSALLTDDGDRVTLVAIVVFIGGEVADVADPATAELVAIRDADSGVEADGARAARVGIQLNGNSVAVEEVDLEDRSVPVEVDPDSLSEEGDPGMNEVTWQQHCLLKSPRRGRNGSRGKRVILPTTTTTIHE